MTNIRNVDLNLLIVLDVLLDERNVSRAAQRLNLSQPAVSGALKRLRQAFGDPLFVRSPQGVRPTPRALELIGPVKSVLHDIDHMFAPPAFEPEKATEVFTIAATDYAQIAFLAPLIRIVHEAAPGIRFAVVSTDIHVMSEQFERQAIDFAVTVPEMAPPQCHGLELYGERYVCAVRKDHPRIGRAVDIDTFCDLDHILVAPSGDGFHGPTDDALSLLGRRRNVVVSVPTFLGLPSILRDSNFIAVAPERVFAPFRHVLEVFAPPIDIPDFTMMAYWHERTHLSPAHRWLRDRMASIADDLAYGLVG